MTKKLDVAFVWHMHQPIYKDPVTNEYMLPWVRLHALKDYYDMVSILEEFPVIHQTFNLAPSLIEQLSEYAAGNVSERFLDLTLKRASDLTREDKIFILKNFFFLNWENMIKPFPRFLELLKKRGFYCQQDEAQEVMRYFSKQDFVDLQVLFNLAWIDPHLRRKDEVLNGLERKGSGYDENDKAKVLESQNKIIRGILPKYRQLCEVGIIEISTSPYYHPILPLLCDSYSAKEAMPNIRPLKKRFKHPEDALAQVRRALQLHEETFGARPRGMWPSEGSLSDEVVSMLAGEGIEWTAADEAILGCSQSNKIKRDKHGKCLDDNIYKPYTVSTDEGEISVVFRDSMLSDLIGFEYYRWEPEEAAEDFMQRLTSIYNSLNNPEERLVSIILDGENPWDYYKNDGRNFLLALYKGLSNSRIFRCTTISEHLNKKLSRERLPHIHPGSWIDHNFKIWIGDVEDNAAWDYISEARDVLSSYEEERGIKDYSHKKPEDPVVQRIRGAWEDIYIAEGSDWFWWYGDEHSSENDDVFDYLFRAHLKKVYEAVERDTPPALDVPITLGERVYEPQERPVGFIYPEFDGRVTNYFEWLTAGRIGHIDFGSAMHKMSFSSGGIIDEVFYGFNTKMLFLRFDYISPEYAKGNWGLKIEFIGPPLLIINAEIKNGDAKANICKKNEPSMELKTIAADRILEIGLDFKELDAREGDEIRFFITIEAAEKGIARWPIKGYISLEVPTEDFERYNWLV